MDGLYKKHNITLKIQAIPDRRDSGASQETEGGESGTGGKEVEVEAKSGKGNSSSSNNNNNNNSSSSSSSSTDKVSRVMLALRLHACTSLLDLLYGAVTLVPDSGIRLGRKL